MSARCWLSSIVGIIGLASCNPAGDPREDSPTARNLDTCPEGQTAFDETFDGEAIKVPVGVWVLETHLRVQGCGPGGARLSREQATSVRRVIEESGDLVMPLAFESRRDDPGVEAAITVRVAAALPTITVRRVEATVGTIHDHNVDEIPAKLNPSTGGTN